MMVGGKKILICDLKLVLEWGGREGGCPTDKIRGGGVSYEPDSPLMFIRK
jgi:hypothetical protein